MARCASVSALSQPSETSPPLEVLEAQLKALQRGEVQSCFDVSSITFRRLAGPRQRFERIVREAPEYKPLIKCERYEFLSALQVEPRRWRCRVRVHNTVGRMPFAVEYHMELSKHFETRIAYDLGQCMRHKRHGFRGVIIGWDFECKQNEEWCRANSIDSLPNGRRQPFYRVLVHRKDEPDEKVAYIAQEEIEPTGVTTIEHEYFNEESFVGVDEEMDTWTPSTALREQYPLGLEGQWLIDHVFPDRPGPGFDV